MEEDLVVIAVVEVLREVGEISSTNSKAPCRYNLLGAFLFYKNIILYHLPTRQDRTHCCHGDEGADSFE